MVVVRWRFRHLPYLAQTGAGAVVVVLAGAVVIVVGGVWVALVVGVMGALCCCLRLAKYGLSSAIVAIESVMARCGSAKPAYSAILAEVLRVSASARSSASFGPRWCRMKCARAQLLRC